MRTSAGVTVLVLSPLGNRVGRRSGCRLERVEEGRWRIVPESVHLSFERPVGFDFARGCHELQLARPTKQGTEEETDRIGRRGSCRVVMVCCLRLYRQRPLESPRLRGCFGCGEASSTAEG